MIPWWVWAAALILFVIAWLIWKIVVVPTLTTDTDKDSYFREETAHIAGNLSTDVGPLEGVTVKLAIEPPAGDVYVLPDATTDADGNYSVDWEVQADAVEGVYTLAATAFGVTAAAAFTQISPAMVLRV